MLTGRSTAPVETVFGMIDTRIDDDEEIKNELLVAFVSPTLYQPIPRESLLKVVVSFLHESIGQFLFGPSGIFEGRVPWIVLVTHILCKLRNVCAYQPQLSFGNCSKRRADPTRADPHSIPPHIPPTRLQVQTQPALRHHDNPIIESIPLCPLLFDPHRRAGEAADFQRDALRARSQLADHAGHVCGDVNVAFQVLQGC